MKNFFIDMLAFGALISSVLVITSKNPVIAVIFLISVFVNAAGYLICLGVGFLGLTYLIVYVGAIAVLFLFVIMLLNIRLQDILESGSQYTKTIPLAIAIGSLFIYEIFTIIPFSYNDISLLSSFLNLITNLKNNFLLYRLNYICRRFLTSSSIFNNILTSTKNSKNSKIMYQINTKESANYLVINNILICPSH